MKKVVWFVLFLAMAGSCLEEPNCLQIKNNNLVGVSFKTMSDGRGDTVTVIRVTAAGTDKQFDSLVTATAITVPVNFLSNSTSLTIETTTRKYLLDLSYQSKPQFISTTCGETFTLSGLSILSASGMDSIKLVNSAFANPANANINIYRCPQNRFVKLSFRLWGTDTLARGTLDARAISSVSDDYSGTTYYQGATTNTVYLPLNIAANKTLFTINFADGTTKKLNLSYDVKTETKYNACGSQKFPRKLAVIPSGQDFENLHMKLDSVYDPPKTNYEVFRH